MAKHLAHHRIRHKHLTRKQEKTLIARTVLVVAVIEPLLTLPQIYEIWILKKAEGVSPLTWGLYIVPACIWLLYGLQLKDKPIIFSSALWIFVEVAVLSGIIIHS